ncbi:hypothetical protein QJS04_geneDACA009575 [Acorus gramineus]|uniref:Uncharacterized protein n=1 Tax=Acorus gramineus TaxID=55184 RepID=A0AAV9B7T6_ACOGR|nr:hypothetical protein QJS04_geneDACA009575 [Acorus gramineus]
MITTSFFKWRRRLVTPSALLFSYKSSSTGLSLKYQELIALFLPVRVYYSTVMEFDIHTLLDSAMLAATLWVVYMMRFKLKVQLHGG